MAELSAGVVGRGGALPGGVVVARLLPGVAALVLAGLSGMVPASLAGEIRASGGGLSLGTAVNGVVGGSCVGGECGIGGGTKAGSTLFHRFSAFDTRGAIGSVLFDTQGQRRLVVGVTNGLGSHLDKPIGMNAPAGLIWLSPGGIQLGSGVRFVNVPELRLSTATGLRFAGGGQFDVFSSTAAAVAGLTGDPLPGSTGLVSEAAALAGAGLSGSGDVTVSGGLLTVEGSLLLDAQGGNVLLQAAGIEAPGGAVEVRGRSVLQAAPITVSGESGGRVAIEASGTVLGSAAIEAKGSAGTGGEIRVRAGEAVVQTSAAVLDASGSAAGGTVSVQGGQQVFSSATIRAQGRAGSGEAPGAAAAAGAPAAGAAESAAGSRGAPGGTIELSGKRVTLAAAELDASGEGGGGAVRVGGGLRGAELSQAGRLADSTEVNAGTTLRADAGSSGRGGEVVVWAEGQTRYRGSASARGGAGGGDGGLIEVSGRQGLAYAGSADASAARGKAGSLLLDPKNIVIDAAAPSSAASYQSLPLLSSSPAAGNLYAGEVEVLSGGNVVATDPLSDAFGSDSGAAYLFSGSSGALISALTGSAAGDRVGSGGITALSNGDFVISSPEWVGIPSQTSGTASLGAVTWGSASLGVNGAVSSSNSLVGASPGSRVGSGGITALSGPQGDYVVSSPEWASGQGAATWGSSAFSGARGLVLTTNSLFGGSPGDRVSSGGITALADGKFVVLSPEWSGARGAATAFSRADALNGFATGLVSESNSLVGSQSGDAIGSGGAVLLTSGTVALASPHWNGGAGAVTLMPRSTSLVGAVSSANSLVGSLQDSILAPTGDRVGSGGITALAGGNAVVLSPEWNGGAGAATWLNGNVSAGQPWLGAVVSSANSLVGSSQPGAGPTPFRDRVGSGGVTPLPGGGYVVSSPEWNEARGAATWGSSAGGVQGEVSSANSLVGESHGDRVSGSLDPGVGGIVALSNGHYVVSSPDWGHQFTSSAGSGNVGAVTWGSSAGGVRGVVLNAPSLLGTVPGDRVGSGGITPLANGNYVVSSPDWGNGLGAVTWRASGDSGLVTLVQSWNSLTGATPGDQVGSGGVAALSNGHYVVSSPQWQLSAGLGSGAAGAATWGDGNAGVIGSVGSSNSLIGQSSDRVGSGGITPLANGNFVVSSPEWNNTTGAVTWASGSVPLIGAIGSSNSLGGGTPGGLYGSGGVRGVSGDSFLVNSPFGFTLTPPPNGLQQTGRLDLITATPAGTGLGPTTLFSDRPDQDLFLTPAQIAAITANGTALQLQANNDITLRVNSPIMLSGSGGGTPGNLSFEAGRSIALFSSIDTAGASLSLLANSANALQAYRDGGDATLSIASGSIINAGDGAVSLVLAEQSTGLSNTAGNLELGNIFAGSIYASGAVDVTVNDTLVSPGTILVTSRRDLSIGSGVLVSSSGLSGQGEINLQAGRDFILSGEIASSQGSLDALLLAGQLDNGAGSFVLADPSFDLQGGTASLYRGVPLPGSLAPLNLTDQTITLNAGTTLRAGAAVINNGTSTLSGDGTGTLQLNELNLLNAGFNSLGSTETQTLSMVDSALQGSGNILVTGSFGFLGQNDLATSGTFTTRGSSGATSLASGERQWLFLNNNTTWLNEGSLSLVDNGSKSILDFGFSTTQTNTLRNAASGLISTSGSQVIFEGPDGVFENQGLLLLNSELRVRGVSMDLPVGGTIDLQPGSLLRQETGSLLNQGVISGSGSITLDSGTLVNEGGTLRPGGFGSIGTLTINSPLLLASFSWLETELLQPAGSPEAPPLVDRVVVNGPVTLGGSLLVDTIPSTYTPPSSTAVDVLTSSSTISGSFASTTPASLSGSVVSLSPAPGQAFRLFQTGGGGGGGVSTCPGICWDGGDGTNTLWSNPLNWVTDAVPLSTDTVFLNKLGGATITLTTPETIAALFSSSDNTLTILSGGSLTISGSSQVSNLAGGVVIDAGSLVVDNPAAVTGLQLKSGSLSGSASLSLSGAGNSWSGGEISALNMAVQSGATLTLEGDSKRFGDLTLTNQAGGTINWSGGDIRSTSTGGSVLNAGTFDIQGDLSWGRDSTVGSGVDYVVPFTNTGTLLKSAGSGTAKLGDSVDIGGTTYNSSVRINNSGLVEAQSGTLRLFSGPTIFNGGATTSSSGEFRATSADSAIDFYNGNFGLVNGARLSGAGANVVSGSYLHILGTTPTASNLWLTGSGGGAIVGDFSGTLTIEGNGSRWSGGAITQARVLVADAAKLSLDGGSKSFGDFTLETAAGGRIDWTSGDILSYSNDVGSGSRSLINAGTFDIGGDLTWTHHRSSSLIDLAVLVTNTGTLAKSAGTGTAKLGDSVVIGGVSYSTTVDLSNSGTVDVQNGVLQLQGAFNQTGHLNLSNASTFSKAGGFTNTGTINGTGSVDVGAGNTLTNAGMITPGGTGAAGTLTINGNLALTPTSQLQIELLGSGATPGASDQLVVSGGSTNLDGSLIASLAPGYTPTAGSTFDILTSSGGISGSFVLTNIPAAMSGDGLGHIYRLTQNSSGGGGSCSVGFCWVGGGADNLWSNAANWFNALVPGGSGASSDLVYLSLSGGSSVTLDDPRTIEALFSDSGNSLSILSGGSLTLLASSEPSRLYGALEIQSGGALTVEGNQPATLAGGFLQSGGSVAGAGSLRLEGTSNLWGGGSWSGGGSTEVAPGASLTIAAADNAVNPAVLNGRTLRVDGGGLLNLAAYLQVAGGSNTLQIDPGAQLSFVADLGAFTGMQVNGGSLNLDQRGSLQLASGVTSTVLETLNDTASLRWNATGATSLAAGAELSLYTLPYGTDLSTAGVVATISGPLHVASTARLSSTSSGLTITPSDPADFDFDGTLLVNAGSTRLDLAAIGGSSIGAVELIDGTLQLISPADPFASLSIGSLTLSGGTLTGSGALDVSTSFSRSNGVITAGAFSDLSITQASGTLTPGALEVAGDMSLDAPNGAIAFTAPVRGTTIMALGTDGLSLSSTASLTATGASGFTIGLASGSGVFQNNAGAGALVVEPTATWQIYADNPTTTPTANLGGLAYAFKQYGKTPFDAVPIAGSGNGLFYADSPTLTVSLVAGASVGGSVSPPGSLTSGFPNGSGPSPSGDPAVIPPGSGGPITAGGTGAVSKEYDGTTAATLVASNYSVGGVLSGDAVVVNKPSFGSYDSRNVGVAKSVSVSGIALVSASESTSAIPVYGYTLANTTATAPIGTITKAPAVVTANSGSKVYDGTTQSISGFSATGLVGSDTSADLSGVSAGGSGRNAGAYVTSASGSDGNYSLSFVNGVFTINQAPLTLTAATDSRVYNGTTSSIGTPTVTSGQVFSGDTLSGLSQAFASKNVLGTNQSTLTVSGYSLTDGSGGNNYAVSLASASGTITPAPLTISAVSDSREYDGTTASSGLPVISAGTLFGGDSLSNLSQSYSSRNVQGANGSTLEVNPGYVLSDGNSGQNYAVSLASASGTISPRVLIGVAIAPGSSIYGSALSPGAVSFANVLGSDAVGSSATVNTLALSTSGKPIVGSYSQSASGLTGADAGNYSFSGFTTATPNYSISPLALSGAAIASGGSIYGSALSPGAVSFANVLGSDAVGSSATVNTLALSTSGKPIVGSYSQSASGLTGADAGNYSFSGFTTATPNYSIDQAPITISAVTDSRLYNGTTSSIGTPTVTSGQVFSGDTLSGLSQAFASKNVLGTNQSTLTVSGYSLTDGSGGNNYAVSLASASGTITPAPLTISAVSDSRVYDGTTASSGLPVISAGTLFGGDSLSNLSQSYSSRNVQGANGSTLEVNPGYVLSDGNGGQNYAVSLASASGTITPAPLTVAFAIGSSANSPVLAAASGTVPAPSLLFGQLQGLVAGDAGTVAVAVIDTPTGLDGVVTPGGEQDSGQTGGSGTPATPRAVAVGEDAGNYTVTAVTVTTSSGTVTYSVSPLPAAASQTSAATREQASPAVAQRLNLVVDASQQQPLSAAQVQALLGQAMEGMQAPNP